MTQKLNWEAYSSKESNFIIDLLKSRISSSDGYIINFNMFSDLALSLSIGIDKNKVIDLHESISEILSVSELDQSVINQKSKKEWCISQYFFRKRKREFNSRSASSSWVIIFKLIFTLSNFYSEKLSNY
jgi:hypothetical protein